MSKRKVMKSYVIATLAFGLILLGLVTDAVAVNPSVQLRPRGGMQRRQNSFKQQKKSVALPTPSIGVNSTPATKTARAMRRPAPGPNVNGSEVASDTQPVKIALFPKDGNVPLGQLNSIVVSSRVVAARLEKKDDFQYYARRLRVLISGTKYVSLKLSDLDLTTGWMLFQADENLPMEAPQFFPRSLPATLGSTFGYTDPWEFTKDWGSLIEKLRSDRAIASKLTPGMIIERELSDYDLQNMNRFTKSGRKIEVEKFVLSPMAENFQCLPANVKVKNELSQMVSGASAVTCHSPGAEGSLGLRVEAGVIDFWANREFTNSAQTQLLENLAFTQFKDHKTESEKADNSTHTTCQKSHLTDSSIEVHYCTRTLRAAPNFQDTVAVFGKRSRAKFLYTILRTGALSESSTKKAIESVLNTLEENQ